MLKNEEPASWDDGVYGTGRVQPPKSHGGVIAALLITVIFLVGLVTLLGLSNVRMFQELNSQSGGQDLSIIVSPTEAAPYVTASASADGLYQIDAVRQGETQAPAATTPAPIEFVAGAEGGALSLQEIYVKCIPSVVSITAQLHSGATTGTGVILSSDGYIVTNYHVIEGAEYVSVQLTDDRILSAWVVGSDPVSDLAVLQVTADNLVSAVFGDSDSLRVGDSVVAIGDPLGVKYRGTMTNGIVSAINRNVNVNGRTMNLIQTNAALNSGNSGGPLINDRGEVIGINTIKIGAFTDKAGVEGIGFAIPVSLVKDIVVQILSQGYVSGRPFLGITGESISMFYQRYYRLPAGLYVTDIAAGSNVEKAGLRVGDILLSVDGVKVYSQTELDTLLYKYAAGDTVTIVIYRDGRSLQASIVLQEAGTAAQPGPEEQDDYSNSQNRAYG